MDTSEDIAQEQIAIDIVTGSLYSINFLKNITTAIFDPKLQSLEIGEIYDQWLKNTGISNVKDGPIPYNYGSIIGCLYCGILLAKEKWFDLLPDVSIKDTSSGWGLSSIKCIAPEKPTPTIKYVIKRIRNALGHGNILINFSKDGSKDRNDKYDFEKKVTLKFHDVNVKRPSDTCDVELTLLELSIAVKQFHKIAYSHVTAKHNKI